MVVQYSQRLLDDWVAPSITSFSEPQIIGLEAEDRICRQWMLHFGLLDQLGARWKPVPARRGRQVARRTAAAIRAYEAMRALIDTFFINHAVGSPKLGLYFEALDAAEIVLLQIQMALEGLNHKNAPWIPIDVSDEPQRSIIELANDLKHFGEKSYLREGNGPILPLWFVSDGVTNGRSIVTFDQLHETLKDLENVINEFLKR
jgi:hypothetical protein